jgi:hypothetical protein
MDDRSPLRVARSTRAGLSCVRLPGGAASTCSAPQLLYEKLRQGEVDAGLSFWNFCARLEAQGYRRLYDVRTACCSSANGQRAPFSKEKCRFPAVGAIVGRCRH